MKLTVKGLNTCIGNTLVPNAAIFDMLTKTRRQILNSQWQDGKSGSGEISTETLRNYSSYLLNFTSTTNTEKASKEFAQFSLYFFWRFTEFSFGIFKELMHYVLRPLNLQWRLILLCYDQNGFESCYLMRVIILGFCQNCIFLEHCLSHRTQVNSIMPFVYLPDFIQS